MASLRSIALLVETSTSWGRGIVRGVTKYVQEHEPWLFFVEPRGRSEKLLLPSGWRGDGILARVNHARLAQQIVRLRIPAVNVSWFDCGNQRIPKVSVDEHHGGQLAAQHLLDRGFESFAYCGPVDRPGYTDHILTGFLSELTSRNLTCAVYKAKSKTSRTWLTEVQRLGIWLANLPKPTGVLAWSDVRGRQVSEACAYARVDVPEHIAIITGEYDLLMNQLSSPHLTTIDYVPETIGFEAARVLGQMMNGEPPPASPILLRSGRVITRHSTDITAIEDRLLAEALKHMREHAQEGIKVADVLRQVPISRRVLEQKCRAVLGRSPAEDIRRHRLEHAKRLLIDTELSIPSIARLSGFRDGNALTRRFRNSVGMPPSRYRKMHKR